MTINDAHCHFFSAAFLNGLARQRGRADTAASIAAELGWEQPGTPQALADRWAQALDDAGVGRSALIASVPGDEESVAVAVSHHRRRFVGFFMVDPRAADAEARVTRALVEHQLRTVCLFPAMHDVPLDDERISRVVAAAAAVPGAAVFVHCGVLSIGVRKRLGLTSRFNLRLGDPLAVAHVALQHPQTAFIIPHFGAGLFREALMAAEAAPNIYLDTSSSNRWITYSPGLTLDAVFETVLAVLGPARLLFGTDSSFFPRGWQRPIFEQQRDTLSRLGVNEADTALIFGGNFDRIFA